jgi:hypothetical protein
MDAWAPRRTGNGIDHQARRADEPCLHGCCGLDRAPFLHQRGLEPAANLGEPFWQYHILLGAIHLDLPDPTGRPHRHVGPPPATDRFIGAGPCMFQEFQCQEYSRRDGRTPTRGEYRAPLGEPAANGRDPCRPRQRLGPWAEWMRFRDEVRDLEACATSRQPMLEVS